MSLSEECPFDISIWLYLYRRKQAAGSLSNNERF